MKRIWKMIKGSMIFLWVLLVVCFAVVITMDNPEPVVLNLFIWPIEFSLGVMFFGVLVLGLVLGLSSCLFSLLWSRRSNRRLQAKLNKLQTELENTRMISSHTQIK